MPASTTVRALLDRYDAIFLDAYGVLNDTDDALPGAIELIEALEQKPYALCTNDASRLPATIESRLASFGLFIPSENVVTAGGLIAPYFEAHGLSGARTIVLGTADSRRYVIDAGGVVVSASSREAPVRVIVMADDGFEPFKETLDDTVSAAGLALEAGQPLDLVLPNPDVIFPRPNREVGVGSGAICALLEAAIQRRHPGAPRFTVLGKPKPAVFEAARRRLGLDASAKIVMIGDQLDTDIAGAQAAGIDSALVAGGISTWRDGLTPEPTWLLPSLRLDA